MASGLTRRELGTRVAILTALEKLVGEELRYARSELNAMALEAYEEDGVSGIDLMVGDEKVGKLSVPRPSIAVAGGNQFGIWAYEHGRGRKVLTVDVTDVGQDVLDALNAIFDGNAMAPYYECQPYTDAKAGLKVVGGHVVDEDGEVVPGLFAKRPAPRVTGCKPRDVGAAMAIAGDGSTIAGLLTGGE